MKEKIKKIFSKAFGYMGVVDTQIKNYNRLKKAMPELSEDEILNKLIFSRIKAPPRIGSEEEEYVYYVPLLHNPRKDLELVISHIVTYEYLESRKEKIKRIPDKYVNYVIEFQLEYVKYIQEKIKENKEKFNN